MKLKVDAGPGAEGGQQAVVDEKMVTQWEWNWFDKPENVARARKGFYVVLVLLIIPDFFMHKHQLFHPVEKIPGFYAIFGLFFSGLIVLISRLLGYLVKRKENYYD